jgi:iron complex transport system ATP-binding protein
MTEPAALATQNLSLAYETALIVQDLSVQIPQGKITVLVGPNGCGKSTLLKGLARLLKPKQGSILLSGQAIHTFSTRQVARQMGILPQGPVAPEGLTVKDLVAQGRYPHQQWWQQWSTQDEQITLDALTTTGLMDLINRPLDYLSGGQKQRAWIAMALAQNTPILLLDEPTTFLDLAHQIEILELLWELNRVQGRTIVMVLHDLNQACRYADHLIALKEGQIVTEGNPRHIVNEAMVQQVFALECTVIADPVTGSPLCIPLRQAKLASALVSPVVHRTNVG